MDTNVRPITPPSSLETGLIQAGVHWDAVRAPERIGKRVLALLGDSCGAVIHDPFTPCFYWLTPAGSATGWEFPGSTSVYALGRTSWLAVPPREFVGVPGLRWARPVEDGRMLTPPERLYAALDLALTEQRCPHEVMAG